MIMHARHGDWGTLRRAGALVAVPMAAMALAGLLIPAPARALTASAPSNVLRAATVKFALTSGDPTGTVAIIVDGSVVRSQIASATGSTVTFSSIALTTGWHTIQGRITSADASASPVLSGALRVKSWQRPTAPGSITPASGALTARKAHISARVGAQTTRLSLYINGHLVATRSALPGSIVRFTYVTMPSSRTTFKLVAANPVAKTTTSTRSLRRLTYPGWGTCIIIDKSDFKLYWIRSNILIKAYPIAHGKHNCTPVAVWRIDAKYKTSPSGVYGPRKMRLFRQSGTPGHYHYSFTAYGIHGTNQPWVIGTMASHGCIRMYNKDVLALWPQVPLHTMVQTRQ